MKRVFRVTYKKIDSLLLRKQPEHYMEQVYFITGIITTFDIPIPAGFEIHSITEILEAKEMQLPAKDEKTFN